MSVSVVVVVGVGGVGGGGSQRGRRVVVDYCCSSRHFISSEISISPPY